MKIGIMGGTFDPIHNGHLMLGEYAFRQFELDEIWFMPNGNPPHKQSNQSRRTDAHERGQMVSLAISNNPVFKLQDYEINRTEISYSYQTMEYFTKEYPNDQFYFIIGADSLFSFDTWVHPERIVKCCTILAAYRDDMNEPKVMQKKIDELNKRYHADIRLMITPLVHAASSDLRKKLQQGQDVSNDIPENVLSYIEEHQLYRE